MPRTQETRKALEKKLLSKKNQPGPARTNRNQRQKKLPGYTYNDILSHLSIKTMMQTSRGVVKCYGLALLATQKNKGWSCDVIGAIIAKLTYRTALWLRTALLWIHICTVLRADR